MRRAALLLLLSLAVAPLPAQVVLSLAPLVGAADHGGFLRAGYRVELHSDWPQLTSATLAGCVNGGAEQLSGRLGRTAEGAYAGELERRTTILFCGVHGRIRDACQLTLRSTGTVDAQGDARVLGSTALLKLRWSARPEGAAPEVSGDCPAEFAAQVQRMYLAVVHGLELPLPAPGEAMRRVALEDYGWVVQIEGEDH